MTFLPSRLATSGLVGLMLFWLTGCATTSSPALVRVVHPVLKLPVPKDPAERAYLGLPAEATDFSLAEIDCELLIIDCFDMYCHFCQTGAPKVHRIYELIEERGLRPRIRMIGFGVGNTPLETELFRRKMAVPFPVFSDRSNALARQFGPVRLPSLIVLRRQASGWAMLWHHAGIPHDPEAFLNEVLERARQPVAHTNAAASGAPPADCLDGLCPVPLPAIAERERAPLLP
ncbi:MAG: hypothetical protein D6766_00195 [Verrucomicrobia bacterium]|nr:MAG: hypothetical protein D6766_00195 [Verrucomicrobiota bacterium]